MDYREFLNKVKNNILDYMPEEYANAEIRVDGTMKNNGVLRQGICIVKEGTLVSPKIYLEEFYKSYEAGMSMEDVCSRIANEYMEHAVDGKDFDISIVTDFEKAKESITTKVVSAKNNKTLMRERPSTKLDDLAVFYQIQLPDMADTKASIPITNQMLANWGVSVNELHQIAVENTERINPAKLVAMESMLFGMEENLFVNVDKYQQCAMLVLTNTDQIGGANVIANKETLSKVCDVINDSYYILPSSVHEILVVPKGVAQEMGMTPKELGAMVRDVNAQEVDKEERLSDHIYEFDKDKKVLETVKDSKEKEKDFER